MNTLAGLFGRLYRVGDYDLDLSGVRLHVTGGDAACRALGARAMTIGTDIYFSDGAFAPHTRRGLWLLAHEVAHVVQRARGLADADPRPWGPPVGPPDSVEEREAAAAADAVLAGRPFTFVPAPAAGGGRRPVIQRYMAWEHYLLGELQPGPLHEVASGGPARQEQLEAACEVLAALGGRPRDVDADELRARHPGLELVRLPGSGLVVTLGELNVLPDYIGDPMAIEEAPAAYLEPLVQSVRSWSIAELTEATADRPRRRRTLLPGALSYPRHRWQTELREGLEVDALGTRSGLRPWERYSAVVGRNAGHFAPLSWHRWRSYHLLARDLAERAKAASCDERDALLIRARIHAGYADHFLQDSFAAGHLVNKTLVMQWYIEWLAGSGFPYRDRHLLGRMTSGRQPDLHHPCCYEAETGADRDLADPESVVAAPTLAERIAASGVTGKTGEDRRKAYAGYLAMLASNVANLAPGVAHRHLNDRSLVVSAGADAERFRLYGDYKLLAAPEGARRAAAAAAASRRAIAELISRGGTDIPVAEIFGAFPSHVEVEPGEAMIPLRQWHDGALRDLCLEELFRAPATRVTRILLSATWRRLDIPAADARELWAGQSTGAPAGP